METRTPGPSSLLGSLREFVDALMGSVHDRIELLSVELQEEKHRLIQLLIWLGAIMFLSLLVVIFVSLVLVVIFWETARIAVVVSLAGAYLAAWIVVVLAFRRFLQRQPKPFSATLRELREDRACLRTNN